MAEQIRSVSKIQAPSLDKSLIIVSTAKDPDEFLLFYDAYFPRVYNYIRFRCVDAVSTDDLTSIVFEKALSNFKDFDPERGQFGAWLFGIARNTVNSYLKFTMKQATLPLDEISDQKAPDPLPEESLIQSETKGELLSALSKLDSRERDLLSLKFAGHLTNRRIAEITSLTDSNVGIILHRAIQKLRSILANQK